MERKRYLFIDDMTAYIETDNTYKKTLELTSDFIKITGKKQYKN